MEDGGKESRGWRRGRGEKVKSASGEGGGWIGACVRRTIGMTKSPMTSVRFALHSKNSIALYSKIFKAEVVWDVLGSR